jgi:integrase/recombinase XerD
MNIKDIWEKMVGIEKQRNYAANTENHLLAEEDMKQARTLNDKELNLLLLYTSTRKYAERDRCMLLLTYWGGMRIGEVAATKIKDVLANDGSIKQEINLTAEQTKGKYARTVVLNDKLRKELMNYLLTRFDKTELIALTYSTTKEKPLLYTKK